MARARMYLGVISTVTDIQPLLYPNLTEPNPNPNSRDHLRTLSQQLRPARLRLLMGEVRVGV
eukprot:232560-Amorphochlora_amoeboformis.AAC.1